MEEMKYRLGRGRRFAERIHRGDAFFQIGSLKMPGLPRAIQSNGDYKHFSGANLMILLQVMRDKKWQDPRFFTLPQIKDSGWAIKSDADKVALQFLVSTENGMPLEKPKAVWFHVVNGSQIVGVPTLVNDSQVQIVDAEKAVTKEGAGWVETDGLNFALQNWLFDLQKADIESGSISVSDAILRARLALSLLEADIGLVSVEQHLKNDIYGNHNEEWALKISDDPLAFFEAARASEILFAQVSMHIQIAAQERVAQTHIDNQVDASLQTGEQPGGTMSAKGPAEKSKQQRRIEQMFEEREAVLAVPYAEKDKVYALGAVWYAEKKLWFVPKGVDVNLFKEWNPRLHVLGPVATKEALIESFTKEMMQLGLEIPKEILDDGKWHHVPVNSNTKKNLSGSYIFSLNGGRDGGPIGTIMNRYNGERTTWRHDGVLLTPEQRARMRAEALVREAETAKEIAVMHENAAVHAKEIMARCKDADNHPYVLKKGIPPEGLKQISGNELQQYPEFNSESGTSMVRKNEQYLIVPMMNEMGEIRAVEAISEDGAVKMFMRGGQKKGTMLVLGGSSFNDLVQSGVNLISYSEGIATGASFRKGSEMVSVVCFDAGNLETIVALTTTPATAHIKRVLAVDDDQFHVERTLGFLSEHLGLNPLETSTNNAQLKVLSGMNMTRSVSLGEAIIDGEWHNTAKGQYCAKIEYEEDGQHVRAIAVQVVNVEGKKLNAFYNNRGMEAGKVALEKIEKAGGQGVILPPTFESIVGRPTDWNDLHKREGLEAIRKSIMRLNPSLLIEPKGEVKQIDGNRSLSR